MSLSPYNNYVTRIWNDKNSEIFMETKYGGEDSETVPMGYVQEYIVQKKKKYYGGNRKQWRNIMRKLSKASVDNAKAGSLQLFKNG